MELKEFLLRFLPEYDRKVQEAKCNNYDDFDELDGAVILYMHWQNKHFAEALENFATLLCEKQKAGCYERVFEKLSHDSVFDAERPKFESL
jgi:hypothetical protein